MFFKTKVNLTEAVIKAEAFAVTYNKRTNGYNFAITKSENYRSLLKRRNGRKTILETIEKFPELNDERYLTDFERNLLKNKLVNGIVNNFHSDALFLDIVIKSNGELELISNKTKKKIKSIIVGDRDFIYINDSSYYYASEKEHCLFWRLEMGKIFMILTNLMLNIIGQMLFFRI